MAVRKRKSLLALPLLACLASSCAVDLGTLDKSDGYKTYYNSVGDVRCLFDGGEVTYNVEKSLFNSRTMNEFAWENGGDAVEEKQYLYLIFSFEKELTVESIAFYVHSQVTITMELSLFFFLNATEAPQKVKYLTSPETEPIYDSEGNVVGEEPIIYDDNPEVVPSMIHGPLALTAGNWVSIGFGGFKQPGQTDGYLHVDENSLVYLRVENNSGWNVGRLQPVDFNFINLLVRAV